MTAEIYDLAKNLIVQAQAPAGTYGFAAPIERHVVDITACLDGYRVWISGRPYKDFASLSNASRCASALTILDELGALPKEAS